MKKLLFLAIVVVFVGIFGTEVASADCNASAASHANFSFDNVASPGCKTACISNGGVAFSDDPMRADNLKCNFDAGCVINAKNGSGFTAADQLCMAACEQFGGRLEGDYPVTCNFGAGPSTDGTLAERAPCDSSAACAGGNYCLVAEQGKYARTDDARNGKQGYCLPSSLVGTPAQTDVWGALILPGTGTPGTGTPGSTGTPDTGTPGTGTPSTGAPSTGTPGTGTLGTGTPGGSISPAGSTSGVGLIPCGNGPSDPCTLCHFIIGFKNLVGFMTTLVTTVGFVGIFAAGVIYIISAGDDKMMTSAKNALQASLTGFAIVMGAWLIVNVTMWALGANVGVVGEGKNWYTFTCSTTSSAPAVADQAPSQSPTAPPAGPTFSCGVNSVGLCKPGNTQDLCQDGWSATLSNPLNPCPSGTKCCVKVGESTELCAAGTAKCFYGMSSCPAGYHNKLGLCTPSRSICCERN